ncbi:MAG TPA: hypothetical protein VJ810_10395 [Blastocatellia bacterium]|nr:hypothetical protein [Blastocatellia bacterium]
MSDSTSRLPARPSLEQLRKQAKELLRDFRAGDTAAVGRLGAVIPRLTDPAQSDDVILADAQFALAREYGFEKWAELVRQVEAIVPSSRHEEFQQIASDLFAAYHGAPDALQRLGEYFGRNVSLEELRERMQKRLSALPDAESRIANFSIADAQGAVARIYGFESWAKLAESISQPQNDTRSATLGLSSAPPFYKIDWRENTLEPRPPLSHKDWDTIFGVMKEHQITGLNAGGQMTDAVMKRLPQLDHVTRLYLAGSMRLTDEGLKHLAHMTQLQDLDLGGWKTPITDRGLEALRHLTQLRRFQSCWTQGITDAGVANLKFCDHLESVDLLGASTGDGAIDALTGKPNLRRFKTGRLVTDAGLPLLQQFPVFKTWQGGEIKYGLMSFDAEPTDLLLDGPITGKGLASLAGLDGLFGLSFFWHTSALTADGLKPLADLANLGFLGCQGELCNDVAMRHIAAIPRLRMLMGQGTVASDDGFEALSRSQTIEYIWGRECPNLRGRGFTALAAMPALRGLAVSCKNVDDAALSALPRFPALRGLMPMDVTDEGFRHVGRCEKLEDLWCMYCRDTGDAATERISGLSSLKTYYAGATQITDRSLAILGRMPSLESIEFYECAGISNSGVALLATLPRLSEISVGGSPNVTRDGMAVFPPSVRANYW